MDEGRIAEALRGLGGGATLELTIPDVPLDELLFALHTSRFTGAVRVNEPPGHDRIFFREGTVVGLTPRRDRDVPLLGEILSQLELVSRPALAALAEDGAATDGIRLGQALVESELVGARALARAAEEQARRRLFQLYDLDRAPVRIRQGLDSLAYFQPVYLDVRPAIAFGMVVRSSADRRGAMVRKVAGRAVRLVAPYDEQRNSYGLPPPVLVALRDLHEGLQMGTPPALSGLSPQETAGVLLLLDRMRLLTVA